VTFNFSGGLLELKGYPGHRRPSASVDAATPRTVFQRLGDESDERWIFTPNLIWIERRDGTILKERSDPRAASAGHVRDPVRRDYHDPARSTRNTYQVERGSPMANVVKKHSISSELAQKMVDEAVAKARELGVTENVAILDDGGNLKAFSRMDGAPILSIEIAQNKAYTALFGVSTQDFFNFIQGDPSLLAGIPTLRRVAAYGGGFPIKVDGEIVGAIGVSGAPMVQNDVDCASAALALLADAIPTE
jgi:uncharacterized protein GlcG (DUF336 family)